MARSAFLNPKEQGLMALTRTGQNGSDLAAAVAEMERYCETHPRSPSATKRPRIMLRGQTFVALLGSTLEDGIAGLGNTVTEALRAFDVRYLSSTKSSRS